MTMPVPKLVAQDETGIATRSVIVNVVVTRLLLVAVAVAVSEPETLIARGVVGVMSVEVLVAMRRNETVSATRTAVRLRAELRVRAKKCGVGTDAIVMMDRQT